MRILIVICFLVAVSSCNKKGKQTPTPLSASAVALLSGALFEPEPLKQSQVLVTFSLNDVKAGQFDLFKPAIIDVVVEVDVEGELVRHSLQGKSIAEDFYYDDAQAIDLTDLGNDYHFYGVFDVPQGRLHAIEAAFSGTKSEFTHSGKALTLIDAFFNLFPKKGLQNKDALSERRLPVTVRQVLNDNYYFVSDTLQTINIMIDENKTVALEPVESSVKNRQYAAFTPFFDAQIIESDDGFIKDMPLRFYGIEPFYFADSQQPAFYYGALTERVFLAQYHVSEGVSLTDNGKVIGLLDGLKGVGIVDIRANLTTNISGYHLNISEAHFIHDVESHYPVFYEGKITAKTSLGLEIVGKKITLEDASSHHLNGEPFSGIVENEVDDVLPGQRIALTKDFDRVRVLSTSKAEASDWLDLAPSVLAVPRDMLNINQSSGVDTTFEKPLDCGPFVNDCKDQLLSGLDWSRLGDGATLSIVRRAKVVDDVSIHYLPSLMRRYDDVPAFIAELKDQIRLGYRVYRLTGEGTFDKGIFYLESNLQVTVFSEQSIIDDLQTVGSLQGPSYNTQLGSPILKGEGPIFGVSSGNLTLNLKSWSKKARKLKQSAFQKINGTDRLRGKLVRSSAVVLKDAPSNSQVKVAWPVEPVVTPAANKSSTQSWGFELVKPVARVVQQIYQLDSSMPEKSIYQASNVIQEPDYATIDESPIYAQVNNPIYENIAEPDHDYETIDDLKTELEKLRPLPATPDANPTHFELEKVADTPRQWQQKAIEKASEVLDDIVLPELDESRQVLTRPFTEGYDPDFPPPPDLPPPADDFKWITPAPESALFGDNKSLKRVLMAAKALPVREMVQLGNVNAKTADMTEVNATSTFRSTLSATQVLVDAVHVSGAPTPQNMRATASALNQLDIESLHRGDIEKPLTTIANIAEVELDRQSALVSQVKSEVQSIDDLPAPTAELLEGLDSFEAKQVAEARGLVDKVKSQPSSLLADSRKGIVLKPISDETSSRHAVVEAAISSEASKLLRDRVLTKMMAKVDAFRATQPQGQDVNEREKVNSVDGLDDVDSWAEEAMEYEARVKAEDKERKAFAAIVAEQKGGESKVFDSSKVETRDPTTVFPSQSQRINSQEFMNQMKRLKREHSISRSSRRGI